MFIFCVLVYRGLFLQKLLILIVHIHFEISVIFRDYPYNYLSHLLTIINDETIFNQMVCMATQQPSHEY
jgi:hypothetical protein